MGLSNHSKTDREWVKTQVNGNAIDWKETTEGKGVVPDVSGMSFRDAIFLLEKTGLVVEHEGVGRVKGQSISPGAKVKEGQRIRIQLG